jgi:predicted dehydrogenase
MAHFQPTRRRFLAQTGGAAAALMAPYTWTTATTAAESTGDRLGVAAIGVGGRGSGIGHQAGDRGNMVACADVDRKKAEQFASKYNGRCKVYGDYRRILDRKDVDVITCGTPDHWHTRIAIDALKAGKDVYCEKPLTLTIDEGRLIRAAVEKTKRVFQVGTQQRSEFNGVFLKAIAIARSGRLGDKLHATSSVGTATAGGPFEVTAPPAHLDFDFWLGQAPKVPYCPRRIGWDFRWWLEYSGGQVTDWGVHHTDIALWALGGEATGILSAEGRGTFPGLPEGTDLVAFLNGRSTLPPQFNVAREFDCDLELPNGNTINLVSGKNELIIEGDKGKIRVNRGGITGRPVEEIERDAAARQRLAEQVTQLYRGMPLRGHMANFFHCVKTRALPISDVWTHTNSVDACHIANIAMFLKRKVTFDQQAFRFKGDDQADLFLRRVQRSPWEIVV